jgi:cell division protein ZapA (FtsZ GTPase activity inhibitor)
VVRSDADEGYVETLARHVHERIEEVQSTSRPASMQSLAVLAALNIAGELFRERQRRQSLKAKVRERSSAVLALLDKEVEQTHVGARADNR